MPYIKRDEYAALYGDIPSSDFLRFELMAERELDKATTGIDGVRKLRDFFPTDEGDASAIKLTMAHIIDLLYQIHRVEQEAAKSRGYVETEQGMRGKLISSVTAGNESISYVTGGNSGKAITTAIDLAAGDFKIRDAMIDEIIRKGLDSAMDANGVYLRYSGFYPEVQR